MIVKGYFCKDEDGHWFFIPQELKDDFNKTLSKSIDTDDWNEFCIKFQKYMLGENPSNCLVEYDFK